MYFVRNKGCGHCTISSRIIIIREGQVILPTRLRYKLDSKGSLVNQTLSLGCRLSIKDYKHPLGKGLELGLENFHSMACSTDIQILYIVD